METPIKDSLSQFLAPVLAGGWIIHAHLLHKRLHRVRRDPLTGLLTRHGWNRAADRIIRRHDGAAVLIIDLDGFKAVNDTWGHAAGDAVIAAAGQRLTAWCGESGIAGRLGGDEFAVVVRDGLRLATELDELEALLREPVDYHSGQVNVGASIGAAQVADLDTPTREAAMRAADTAMYRVKERTRDGRCPAAPEATRADAS
ncbi:GGDEF domain-containing protein [Streptomyces sp. NPDC014735]|uniref:GGDEF domain-containing protein n=1 Tax=Streptomyces sp. NPDC014735 TaxID=3364887 RepID=UPI0036FC1A67